MRNEKKVMCQIFFFVIIGMRFYLLEKDHET